MPVVYALLLNVCNYSKIINSKEVEIDASVTYALT